MKVPYTFPYQGSKRKLAENIISYIPENTVRLVEPFAGSAAISLAALTANKVPRVILSDKNAPLMALWDAIIHRPSELAEQYRVLWEEQARQGANYFYTVRDRFNTTQRPDYFLFLLLRCVKAAVRYNTNGEFNQSPDLRRQGTSPDEMARRIQASSKVLAGRAAIMSLDYRRVLEDIAPNDVVYLDPPYQGVSGKANKRYSESLSFSEFVDSLGHLNQRHIPYIVSYDGRTGDRVHGERLPESLNLHHIELHAGRSSQATLNGRNADTYEALYLSPALLEHLEALAV